MSEQDEIKARVMAMLARRAVATARPAVARGPARATAASIVFYTAAEQLQRAEARVTARREGKAAVRDPKNPRVLVVVDAAPP